MNFLIGFVPTILVLGILILIHELGHFIACRLTGVRVEKFSIGFGPEIFHVQGNQTRYAVSLFPFGGFVKPAGESASEIGVGGPRPDEYLGASIPKRIFIVIAGVAMNYLLSFFLFVTIFVMGRPIPLAQVGGFVKGYPAESSGLVRGDRIIAVGTARVSTWEDLTQTLNALKDSQVELEIQRQNEIKKLRVPLRVEEIRDIFGKSHQVARLGIIPDTDAHRTERLSLLPALREAFLTEIHLTVLTYQSIFYLATGRLSLKTVSGPIGIMAMTGTAAKMGAVYLLHLTAVLGISLAVINLLPIPALDGGHFLFLLIEAIQRRRVSLEFQERLTQIGFAFLMLLMVLVLYNDLINLQVIDRVKAVFSH